MARSGLRGALKILSPEVEATELESRIPVPFTTMFPHHREHYRVRYPSIAHPVFVPNDEQKIHQVVDCSEKGFRFRPPLTEDMRLPGVGEVTQGEIHFQSGRVARVSGVVVRIQDREVAVHLTEEPIPFGVVVQEQIFLRRHFPIKVGEPAA